jgi:hypothetical protein
MEQSEGRDIASAARRAYEVGRLRSASWVIVCVAPMVGVALLNAAAPLGTLLTGALLYVISAALLWRGQVYGRAAFAGLLAGTVPLLVPMLLRTGASCCVGGGCWSTCMPLCIATGLGAGLLIGLRSAGQREHPVGFSIAAAVVAGLAGSLGCMVLGAAGVLGMVGGVILGSMPLVVGAAIRRAS